MTEQSDSEKNVGDPILKLPKLSKVGVPDINRFDPARPPVPIPLPAIAELGPNPLITSVEENYASKFYERLVKWISEFDESLDQSHEVGVRLVSFGQAIVFHLESMGYWNPSLISFRGHTDKDDPVELIQHVSQISILLTKMPREDTSQPKKPFGFASACTSAELETGD